MTLGNPVWCSLVRLWCWKAGILILFALRFDFEAISWHVSYFFQNLDWNKQRGLSVGRNNKDTSALCISGKSCCLRSLNRSMTRNNVAERTKAVPQNTHFVHLMEFLASHHRCYLNNVRLEVLFSEAYFAWTKMVSSSENRWLHTHPTTQWSKGIVIHLHSQESDILTSLPLENDQVAAMSVDFYRPPALVSVISPLAATGVLCRCNVLYTSAKASEEHHIASRSAGPW